jgi:predicted RNase H-like HicB family nuclease
VAVPPLPGIVTQGERWRLARDAIALHLEDLIAEGEPIPAERVAPQLARATVAVGMSVVRG